MTITWDHLLAIILFCSVLLIVGAILLFSLLALIRYIVKAVHSSEQKLKKECIEPYLKSKLGDIYYDVENGFDINEYEKIGFFSTAGYYSPSKIIINDHFCIYNVDIAYSTGDTSTDVFHGYLAKIKLKRSINCHLLIKNKKLIDSLINNQRKPDMISNHEEFDQIFSIKTDNIDYARKIFGTDVINYILSMVHDEKRYTYKNDGRLLYPYFNKFDIGIVNDELFISYEPYSNIRLNYSFVSQDMLDNICDEIHYLEIVSNELCDLINKHL